MPQQPTQHIQIVAPAIPLASCLILSGMLRFEKVTLVNGLTHVVLCFCVHVHVMFPFEMRINFLQIVFQSIPPFNFIDLNAWMEYYVALHTQAFCLRQQLVMEFSIKLSFSFIYCQWILEFKTFIHSLPAP